MSASVVLQSRSWSLESLQRRSPLGVFVHVASQMKEKQRVCQRTESIESQHGESAMSLAQKHFWLNASPVDFRGHRSLESLTNPLCEICSSRKLAHLKTESARQHTFDFEYD